MHCPLDDQKPLEEQVVIEKFKQCLLVQITSALLITNYDKVLLQIKTAFLLQIKFLQIATRIPNYDKTRNTFSQKSREANWVSSENKQ